MFVQCCKLIKVIVPSFRQIGVAANCVWPEWAKKKEAYRHIDELSEQM